MPGDLRRPGHIQPVRARPGGVLQQVGHTEAAVDLARLAGLYPAGVICRNPQRGRFAARPPQREGVRPEASLTFVTIAQPGGVPALLSSWCTGVMSAAPHRVREFTIVAYGNDVGGRSTSPS
ncbi:MAG: 3,4-dihydroxy-2-butanone-4-phosphate synthase [Gemmatimonadales bacterium]